MIELTGYRDKHEYTNKHGVKSVVYLMDCMDAMAQMGDKEFSLACVDPPYGIGAENHARNKQNGWTQWKKKSWDNAVPTRKYYDRLFSVSQNQIVWGGNYMTEHLPPKMAWIVWDKGQRDFSLADGELAWTSFDKALRIFTYSRAKALQEGKMHPTQKPIALYDWIFHNYANPNDTIFDSHCGSGSSRIAADKHNLPYLATEIDADYFYAHCKRFDNYTAQLTLF
jgi:site-specific DNA-methyltransferase (adenine-specific)